MASPQTLYRSTQAGSSANLSVHFPRVSPVCASFARCLVRLKQTYEEGQMLNSSGNVFTDCLGTRQTPPCEITHMDFGMIARQKNVKDARWFIMSACSGAVIFKMGARRRCLCCCHIWFPPHLFSIQIILESAAQLKHRWWIKAKVCCFLFLCVSAFRIQKLHCTTRPQAS